MMSNSSTSSKNHFKKSNSRDRDKNKSVASESGGSSQSDTPPLIEKDGALQGKFAGIGADSVLCMAEQVDAEINTEAATNLAEDVSYKLRQIISTIALHSEMMKKSTVDGWDVNTVFTLSDISPVVGACVPDYDAVGEDNLCCEVESLIDINEYSLQTQSYVFSALPTVSVEWITDEKSLSGSSNISANLQNYYTKIARAILNLKRKPKEIAVEDLTTNTRIGPIFPNLFNLAVLVLNDDNLNALNVPAKKPLQSNVLDMVDALCSNPCSLDTNIQQQFQRLFPVMVSNILGNGSLAEKMVAILTKITRTWPSFIAIGKGILFDYLSQGTKERLTAPMIRCVLALGRHALVECLGDHLEHLDARVQARAAGLRETILDASTCLFRSEPTTYLEDYVMTDYALYEMLGDSVLPRRTLFPIKDKSSSETPIIENPIEEDFSFLPSKPATRTPKVRPLPTKNQIPSNMKMEALFETTKFSASNKSIQIKIKNCRSIDVKKKKKLDRTQSCCVTNRSGAIASGLLFRFMYKLSKPTPFPILGALTL